MCLKTCHIPTDRWRLIPHSSCYGCAEWPCALFRLMHVHSWEGHGKNLWQNDGMRSAGSDWMCVWKLQCFLRFRPFKSKSRCVKKLPEIMESVFWAPVLLICRMLKAAFSFVCLFMSCHRFFASSTFLRVDACYTIEYVWYSCTNSSSFLSGVELLPCINSLFDDSLLTCIFISWSLHFEMSVGGDWTIPFSCMRRKLRG